MTWTHEHSWKLEAAPHRVFAALTRADELGRWFAERVEVNAAPGGAFRFWGRHTPGAPAGPDSRQTLTRHEPDRALSFRWTLYGVPTEVAIALAEEGEATRLTLHHTVQGELPMPRPRELVDDWWRLAFGNLAAHLAGGKGIVLPDFTDPAPRVSISIHIAAPPGKVFATLMDPVAMGKWLGATDPVIEPRVGGRYETNWKYQVDGRDVVGGPGRILELVPDRRLVLTWLDWRGDESVTGQTIAFDLTPEDGGTRVDFVHSGFERAEDVSDYPFGWVWFLSRLSEVSTEE